MNFWPKSICCYLGKLKFKFPSRDRSFVVVCDRSHDLAVKETVKLALATKIGIVAKFYVASAAAGFVGLRLTGKLCSHF